MRSRDLGYFFKNTYIFSWERVVGKSFYLFILGNIAHREGIVPWVLKTAFLISSSDFPKGRVMLRRIQSYRGRLIIIILDKIQYTIENAISFIIL